MNRVFFLRHPGRLWLLVLLFATGGWGLAAWFAQKARPTPPIRVARTAFASNILLNVAEQQSLFDKFKVRVEFVDFATGTQGLQALLNGEVEIATAFQTPVLLQMMNNAPVRVLATLQFSVNQTGILYRRDRIRQPQDLIGKRLGSVADSTSEYFAVQFLLSEGIPLEKVQRIALPLDAIAGALARDEFDAIAIWEPLLSEINTSSLQPKTGVFRSDLYRDYNLAVTTPEVLAQHSDKLLKVLQALRQAEHRVAADPSIAMNALRKVLSPAHFTVAEGLWPHVHPQLRLDHVLLSELEEERLLLRRHSAESPSNDAPLADFVALTLLEQVDPEAVTLYLRPPPERSR